MHEEETRTGPYRPAVLWGRLAGQTFSIPGSWFSPILGLRPLSFLFLIFGFLFKPAWRTRRRLRINLARRMRLAGGGFLLRRRPGLLLPWVFVAFGFAGRRLWR